MKTSAVFSFLFILPSKRIKPIAKLKSPFVQEERQRVFAIRNKLDLITQISDWFEDGKNLETSETTLFTNKHRVRFSEVTI